MTVQQVNLYTDELRPSKQRLNALSALVALALVVTLVVAAMAHSHWRAGELEQQLADIERQNQQLEQLVADMGRQVAARQPDPALEKAITRLTDTIARRQRLLQRIEHLGTNTQAGFSGQLSALARQVPGDLWLTRVRLGAAPVAIRIEGRARVPELVPGFLQRLGQEPAFTGENFGDFQIKRPEETTPVDWVDFRVATRQVSEGDS